MSVRASIIDIVLVCLLSPPFAFSQEVMIAQQSDAKRSQSGEPPDAETGKSGNSSTTQQTDGQDQTDQNKTKKEKRGSIVAAPLPIVSPAIGAGIVPVLGYIFPFSMKDKISPPSVVGAAGLITDNGSRGFLVGAQLYMKENRYEVETGFVNGNVNYNLIGGDFLPGLQGAKLPLKQYGRVFFGERMRNVGHDLFSGPRLWIGTSVVTIREENDEEKRRPTLGYTQNLWPWAL